MKKAEYEKRVAALRVGLVNAQYELKDARVPLIIIVAGNDRHAYEDLLDSLAEWMDARYLVVRFFGKPTDEEAERPALWRVWRALPPAGRVGVWVGGYLTDLLLQHYRGELSEAAYAQRLAHSAALLRELQDDGAVILKIWLQQGRKALRKHLKSAQEDPRSELYTTPDDKAFLEQYDELRPAIDDFLQRSAAVVPWQIVDATRKRDRNLAAGELVLSALRQGLARPATKRRRPGPPTAWQGHDALAAVELERKLPYPEYRRTLDRLQARLGRLALRARVAGQSAVLVFEGWDAAGKGGAIRRITQALSVRDFRVVPIAAPTDEELARHYLWRFWRRLPRAGQLLIFDRSWYGRVLVERVEGLARPEEWARAYDEINDFEANLTEFGIPVMKFWLHIDADEQVRRFKAREKTPYKKYKITDEDYRNREKWLLYEAAVNEMVERTSTPSAPWQLVPANNKRYARVQVLKTVCGALKRCPGI